MIAGHTALSAPLMRIHPGGKYQRPCTY